MKIVVCIKQVPGTNEVRLDPETHAIIRDGRQAVINPFDNYAVELAVQLKEKLGGSITALSMGIPATERLLRDTESRGVDEACLLSDRAFAGADTLATSYALSLGIKAMGNVDLILCGKMAVDGDTAQIGPELAEALGIHHVTDVSEILEATEKYFVVRKATESGSKVVKVMLPALLTVQKDIVFPRMSTISGVRFSLEAPFTALTAAQVNADTNRTGFAGSPTQVVRTFTPESRGEAKAIEGSLSEQVGAVLNLWKEVR